MKKKNVVMCILKNKGKILLLKRSGEDNLYPNRWSFVSGGIEKGEEPIEAAYREVNEEAGIEKNELRLKKKDFFVSTNREINVTFNTNIFLFEIEKSKVILNEENDDYSWVAPKKLFDFYLAPVNIQVAIKLLGKLPVRKGILAIIYRNSDSFLIVNTRNENLSFIAGAIERGEREKETVGREVKEESGIDVDMKGIKKLPFVNKFTYDKGFLEGVKGRQNVYLAKVYDEKELKWDDKEIFDAKWMSKEEVRKNLTFDHVKDIFEKSLKYLEVD